MKTTLDYLNEVIKRAKVIENDNQLAAHLGITRQAVHQYKNGQNMSVLVAIKVAKQLEVDPVETVSATLHAQAKTETEKEFWMQLYQVATHQI
jgi:predicted transcriptional regulator